MQKRVSCYLLLNLLFLLSCQKSQLLSGRREFISRQSLASFVVETPDPNLICPPIGESLVVSSCILNNNLTLRATLRYMNGEEEVVLRPLNSKHIRFDLVNDEYLKKGGFRTYKLELINGQEEEVASFSHHLFTELINFSKI